MDDCILWTRGKSMGYGITYRDGRVLRAHQAAWLDAGRKVPEGYQLHHVCERKLCINVDHLLLLAIGEHTRLHATGRKSKPRPLKTHCKYGHEYTEQNTYRTRSGNRRCRRCHADDEIRRRADAKADRWFEDEWTYGEMYTLYMGGA